MKAKYLFMAGLLVLSSTIMQAKTMDHLLSELNKQENLTHVSIGPFVMALSSLFTNTMGVKSVNVLCLEDCSAETLEKFNSEIKNLKDPAFEPLITSNEDGVRTKILVRMEDELIRDIVICHVDDEVAVVHLKGKIKPSDIEGVINEHKK